MKGQSVISDLVGIFVLMGLTFMLSIFVIYLHSLTTFLDTHQTFSLEVESLYRPLVAETELLAFMDYPVLGCGNMPVKRIVPLKVEYGDDLDTMIPGCEIPNLPWSIGVSYAMVLSTEDGTLLLYESGDVQLSPFIQEAYVKVVSPSLKQGRLILYVGE